MRFRGPRGSRDAFGVWRSLVARFVRDEEVAGSNPVTPTTNKSLRFGGGFFFSRFEFPNVLIRALLARVHAMKLHRCNYHDGVFLKSRHGITMANYR